MKKILKKTWAFGKVAGNLFPTLACRSTERAFGSRAARWSYWICTIGDCCVPGVPVVSAVVVVVAAPVILSRFVRRK